MARPAWPTITDDDSTGTTGTAINLALFTAIKNYINKNFQLTNLTELTIDTGAVTITEAFHTIDTESDDLSDDLATISGGATGDVLVIRPVNDAHTVVVKHSTGNIWLKGKADLSLDDIRDCLMLIYDGTKWMDVGAGGGLQNIVEDTTPQLGGELDCQAHTIGFTQQTATGDGTTTIDWKLGNKFYFTFGAQNDTFTFTAPTHECNLILVLKQDGTGSRLATWPGTVLWPSNVAPTLSTGIAAVDIVSFYYDGTNYFGVSNLDFS